MSDTNRYAQDWNDYSRRWEQEYGQRYRNLGDEWNDDATAERARDAFYFNVFAERFISPQSTVLEVGPGGGKWTVRLAPRVKKLIVLDVAEEMLNRTRQRCAEAGIENVEYVLSNGRDFRPVADASIDFFFSYDVFVHIAPEDTYAYTQEMNRVLVPGGQGTCHYANNAVPEAWNRTEGLNDWYRGGRHTTGQYFYYSPESLRRMYDHAGLVLRDQFQEHFHCTCMFYKPDGSPVPMLEQLLWHLISPESAGEAGKDEVVARLRSLPGELERALRPALEAADRADDHWSRVKAAEEIRRVWRGRGGRTTLLDAPPAV